LTTTTLEFKITTSLELVKWNGRNKMTHEEIMDALLALLDAVLHNEPTPALMLEKAREALRLLNQVGFQ
jgi:hypothetical protein